MKKSLLFIAALLLTNGSIMATKEKQTLKIGTGFMSTQEVKNAFEKNKPTVFFDLHGVLVVRDWKSFLKGGVGNLGNSAQGWDKARLALQFARVLVSPSFYKGLWQLLTAPEGKNKVTESYFNLIENIGYDLVKKELTRFANDIFKPNPQIIPLLERLKNKGCKLKLFSNIGTDTLNDAKKRHLFPDLFDGETPYFENNIINYERPKDGIYKMFKRQPTAYAAALINASTTGNKAIMIDDKAKNLPDDWAAGICYNSKDQAATEAALEQLGL